MSESLYAALGSTSDYVTTSQNVTGELTPVVTVSPEDGVGLVFRNMVAMGDKRGLPLYAKLKDGSDNPLPIDTEVALGYEAPTDKSLRVVSTEFSNISTYLKKTISEQQNEDNIDSVKHDLDGSEVQVRDIDEFYVLVNSGTQIDHAHSEFYFEDSAVDEVDID